jgi:hypothetical protein
MPYLFAILIAALLLSTSACKSASGGATPSTGAVNANRWTARTDRTMSASSDAGTNAPAIRPANVISGRIVGVQERLRFVIVDFTNSRLPMLDQQLSVYRLDQKVAELKISGPYLGTTVAADVIAGHALEGDLVRDR